MLYMNYLDLLPPFLTKAISYEMVDSYCKRLPSVSSLTTVMLSDNSGFDPQAPFGDNQLIITTQKIIGSNIIDEDNLSTILEVFDYLDFRFSLVFLVELCQQFSVNSLVQALNQRDASSVFITRLECFLSVFVPEVLCTNNPDCLL